VSIRLKRDAQPVIAGPVCPAITSAMGNNKLLVLPGKAPEEIKNSVVDLPAGSYVGGVVTLTDGLRANGRTIGFPAPPADTLNLNAGRTWEASYLVIKRAPFKWNYLGKGNDNVDELAERALAEMGFRDRPPYQFQLRQGKLDRLAYIADFSAAEGGIAGKLENDAGQELLYDVPLRVAGLNGRIASGVWRSDSDRIDYFGCFRGTGYVTLSADRTVDFYAGNVVRCDPALFVSVVIWNETEAWFRVDNPTTREITTEFTTVPAIKGHKPVKTTITVPAGSSLDVKG
jgi:hypothetical protein